ncbi:MAG: hypothetical protein NVS4B3_03590 [Gemmatimonadaceae bacterium]
MIRYLTPVVLGSLALVPGRSVAKAQLSASEEAAVSQTVDGTKVTVAYSRPRARGRTGMFGTLVRLGELWTPGANSATTVAVSKDVTVDGRAVPHGKYSVWLVPARGDWELVLDRDTTLFHTQHPKPRAGQIRLSVRPQTKPFMEALTWWFPDVRATGMTLAMQWDTVYVPLAITVTPTHSAAVAPDAAARLTGRYFLQWAPTGAPGNETHKDTTLSVEDDPPHDLTFTIRYEAGQLRAVADPPMYTSESGYADWVLFPVKGNWYYLGRVDRGQLVEIWEWAQLEFESGATPAARFEIRRGNDHLMAVGKRLP